MRKSLVAGLLVVALALVGSWASATPIIVDSFNYGDPGITYAGTPTAPTTVGPVVETSLSEVLGGTRSSALYVNTFGGGAISMSTYAGYLNHSNPSGSDSDAELNYSNFSNVDLTNGNLNTLIQVVFISTDLGTQLDIELNDGANTNTQSQTATAGGAQSLYFLLSSFTGVDETSIDSVRVRVSGPADLDSRIDFISTDDRVAGNIPEPATMSLLGLGLLALARRRRKS